MSVYLRRCVNLGSAGVDYPGSEQDLRIGGNASFFGETRTKWVRIWAPWSTLQPTPDPPGTGASAGNLAALDAQIAFANQLGLYVILVTWTFPNWANGWDAMTQAQQDATAPDRVNKSIRWRRPDNMNINSDYARWLNFLYSRYSAYSPARPSSDCIVHWLEICNEPNYQWWPQWSTDGVSDVACRLATAFQTAWTVSSWYGFSPGLMGPATSDNPGPNNRLVTSYQDFTTGLAGQLNSLNFRPGNNWIWTHHNYRDMFYGSADYVANVRSILLKQNWVGYGGASNPTIFLTEGGVRVDQLIALKGMSAGEALNAQSGYIKQVWNLLAQDGGVGAGVGMMSNYLWYTSDYDTGLRQPLAWAGGTPRPAYSAWQGLPYNP